MIYSYFISREEGCIAEEETFPAVKHILQLERLDESLLCDYFMSSGNGACTVVAKTRRGGKPHLQEDGKPWA